MELIENIKCFSPQGQSLGSKIMAQMELPPKTLGPGFSSLWISLASGALLFYQILFLAHIIRWGPGKRRQESRLFYLLVTMLKSLVREDVDLIRFENFCLFQVTFVFPCSPSAASD